jgi:hypothetical protein
VRGGIARSAARIAGRGTRREAARLPDSSSADSACPTPGNGCPFQLVFTILAATAGVACAWGDSKEGRKPAAPLSSPEPVRSAGSSSVAPSSRNNDGDVCAMTAGALRSPLASSGTAVPRCCSSQPLRATIQQQRQQQVAGWQQKAPPPSHVQQDALRRGAALLPAISSPAAAPGPPPPNVPTHASARAGLQRSLPTPPSPVADDEPVLTVVGGRDKEPDSELCRARKKGALPMRPNLPLAPASPKSSSTSTPQLPSPPQ